MRKWDAKTYRVWMEMLSGSSSSDMGGEGKDSKRKSKTESKRASKRGTAESVNIGLHLTTLRYFYGTLNNPRTQPDGSGIWFSRLVHDFQILNLEQERRGWRPVPREAVFGFSFKTMTFDPVVYLGYLLGRVRALGGRVVRGLVETGGGLEGVVKGMRGLAKQEDDRGEIGAGDGVLAVINCAGLSARHFLPSVEAEKLFPIRGQTVVVKGQARDAYTYVSIPGVSDDEMLYVIPRPGDTTLLGGCKQAGNWDEKVDESLGERIMKRVKEEGLARELLTRADGGFEVLRHQVGFRPGRKGGPRVEVEKEKVCSVWVVHSYGHGSGGFQASIGCAERVVELVEQFL